MICYVSATINRFTRDLLSLPDSLLAQQFLFLERESWWKPARCGAVSIVTFVSCELSPFFICFPLHVCCALPFVAICLYLVCPWWVCIGAVMITNYTNFIVRRYKYELLGKVLYAGIRGRIRFKVDHLKIQFTRVKLDRRLLRLNSLLVRSASN
jgi:hypothetical protein